MANIERKSVPDPGAPGPGMGRESAVEWMILAACALAWLGVTFSTLLLRTGSAIHGLLCPVRTACEAVLSSRYAAILGIPLPWFGVAFYLTLLLLLLLAYGTGWQSFRARLLGATLALSVIGAGVSAVLMFIQFGILRAFCPLCTASALVAAGLVVASARAEHLAAGADFRGRRAGALAMGIFALLSAVPHLIPATSVRSGTLAVVDGREFTRQQMEEEIGASLHPLQRSIYAIESEWIRRKVDAALLASEAKRSNMSVSDLLAASTAPVKPIPGTEIDSRLATKGLPRTPETIAKIEDELLAEHRERARMAYVENLAKNHRIEVFLQPPEVSSLKIDLASAKVSGPPDARVQLVVFSDFECIHCARLSEVLKRARNDFPGDVLLAYRHFPIERHQRAFPAAVAAECAAEQGAFWEYHDRLYANGGDLSDASLASIAGALGLDAARFHECHASARARAAVEASRADAVAIGIEGVPALFLNGKRIGGTIDYADLSRKIREVLSGSANAAGNARQGTGK